jgi:hypothetical protein
MFLDSTETNMRALKRLKEPSATPVFYKFTVLLCPVTAFLGFCVADGFVAQNAKLRISTGSSRSEGHK